MKEINLNHICKVEGHANLTLKIDKNHVVLCELKATEGARFFEALVLGKKLQDVQEIVSRICGICSTAHTVASVQALEKALDIKPTEKQLIIREMLMIGERIRSHATHLYFLALPDYYGFSSALTMSAKHADKVNDAISLISLGNKIVEVFGGREIHPFLKIKENLIEYNYHELAKKLEESKEKIVRTIEIFSKLDYPKLERETDYLSLRDNEYETISGKIVSHVGKIEVEDYKKHIQESIKEYATSKFALYEGKTYSVGAIARINNNQDQLDSETRKLLKLALPLKNPFHNNVAQAIELLHLVNRAIKLLEKISELDKEGKLDYKIKEGHGVSAVEAPRGTLFHEYKIEKDGKISYCNIITPTVQNLNMMEKDIVLYADKLLEEKASKKKIVLEIEKLIRAYDPCFSCSTHFLKVDWV